MSVLHASPVPSPAPSRRAKGPKPQSRPTRLFTTNSTSSSRPRLDSLTPGPSAPPRLPSHTCPNPTCMRRDNVVQEDDGSWICHHCGTIASEHSRIVSDIQFAETASGAPAVQGQYIGADQTHARSATVGRRPGYAAGGGDGPNSKQLTELSARREILAIMQNLGQKGVVVAQSFIDPALGLFKLALSHNFVQGRSISTVAAVALYLQCRRSKETNEVMLIDIAECIDINVFVLGKMYTKLIQKLYGTINQSAALTDKIDTINPENLIRRFAKGLDFPKRDDRNQIVRDAIRLVQRMDRDWMATGRRPAGICGAALILAARMNNFRRTVREVVLVVKVTEITINKRLEEFSYTDSSNLTVEQFRGITLERDCDPPAFYKARQEKTSKRGRKRKGAPETAAEIEEEEQDEDEEEGVVEVTAQPVRKRARIDSDGFAIPEIPVDPALRRSMPPTINLAATIAEEPPEFSTVVSGSTGKSSIDQALTLAVNSAISEMANEEQASQSPAISSTLEIGALTQSETDASSLEVRPGEQPRRRRGRPKGAKNWQPPPESAAELALEAEIEAEIEGELRKVSESGLAQPFEPNIKSTQLPFPSTGSTSRSDEGGPAHLSMPVPSSSPDPTSEQDTPPSSHPVTPSGAIAGADVLTTQPSETSTTAPLAAPSTMQRLHNPPGVEDTTLIYLDDDPEISSCILSEAEKSIKERIWVAENADWLRKDHVKKIKAELQAAADREAGIDPDDATQNKGKGRGKKKKRGRLGDVSYLDQGDKNADSPAGGEEGEGGGTARSAREATLKMMAHRGYSRRVNYDVFKSLFPEEEEAARQRSSRSSTSTVTAADKRRNSGTTASASGSGSPVPTPAVEKDVAAGAEKTATAATQPSTTTSATSPTRPATAFVTSIDDPAAPSTARPKPRPKPQVRKAVSAVAVPIAEPGRPSPDTPSGPSHPTNPPTSTAPPSSAAAKRPGRAPGGQRGYEEREARRQARAAADAVMTKEWDEEAREEEEVLDAAEEEERAWMARTAPKDGPALATASAGEGVTARTAVRLATPVSRNPGVVRQLPTPSPTQSQAPREIPAPIRSPQIPEAAIDLGEEEVIGSIDDSPLTSLRSSMIGTDDDANEDDDDDDDAADYVDVDEDDDVEAAFAGRFARRNESFDDDDDDDDEDDDEDMG